jgi:hypothetical protein
MIAASKFTRSRREAAITETEASAAKTLSVWKNIGIYKDLSVEYIKSQWFSGKIRACHARAPCSIHGCDILLRNRSMIATLSNVFCLSSIFAESGMLEWTGKVPIKLSHFFFSKSTRRQGVKKFRLLGNG